MTDSLDTGGTDGTGTVDDTGDVTIGPVCGDGIISGDEECDLGSLNGTGMYCTMECMANECGDGYVGPGEGCDDGNLSNDDECSSECGPTTCGDGEMNPGEDCDLGVEENNNLGECLENCQMASCGDGYIWSGMEMCDGLEVGPSDCMSEGFDGGTLVCNDMCNGFDTSSCTTCGNDMIEGDEMCDGTELAGAICDDEIGGMPWTHSGGAPTCDGCMSIDYDDCTFCGDGDIEGTEDCEGEDLNDQECNGVGFVGGVLACDVDCSFDTTACHMCGNGAIDMGEMCDGTEFGTASCSSEMPGFDGGDLLCENLCTTISTVNCCVEENNPCNMGECCSGLSCDGGMCASM